MKVQYAVAAVQRGPVENRPALFFLALALSGAFRGASDCARREKPGGVGPPQRPCRCGTPSLLVTLNWWIVRCALFSCLLTRAHHFSGSSSITLRIAIHQQHLVYLRTQFGTKPKAV